VSKPESFPERELARRSRRGFLTLGGGLLTVAASWTYLRSRPPDGGIPGPFRRVLDWNEKLTSSVLFRDSHLAPEFPPSRLEAIRANGDIGLDDDIENSDWKLQLTPRGSDVTIALALSDIHALPKTQLIAEFKCIEGWSSVVQWGGVRFRDFLQRHAPLSEQATYVAMATPDNEYYIGIDMASALHPQTLLAYEMNGQPLQDDHGAPLRLVTAVKYGIKNIKRIGTISFPDRPPRDYWAERGYDYYAGL
jgi:hypothetical protein